MVRNCIDRFPTHLHAPAQDQLYPGTPGPAGALVAEAVSHGV